ncbi:MAG: 2-oxoacid ferredoxin oxidoreductase [Chloroflexi bacterium]|nr:2-oxoacid ferredoxin oxidoreductase [Chloroflexota bacterium]|tara:strand:+ start:2921 stop:3793 length:873 start_codon:yes stop_codon:yes gene_type:complete
MAKRNPDYDFKWCPGCGDFGVKRAIEMALVARASEKQEPVENSVIVAGIGCSGNLVHLQEGPQPFGIHGIHGRTLPIAYGAKSANPDLNILVVSGDGDFLSIGGEHIAPQARRNLDVTAVVMDNGIYGLTKGQASPTTDLEEVTPTTKFGKLDDRMNPLSVYLGAGARYIVSELSTRVKDLALAIQEAMDFPGFSIVHVQSPCTTYNDTYAALKGDEANGITPLAIPTPDEYDPSDYFQAIALAAKPGIPIGLVYRDDASVPAHQRLSQARASANVADTDVGKLFDGMVI